MSKFYNKHWVCMISFLSYIVGSLFADMGEVKPSYEVTYWHAVTATAVIIGLFVVGYLAGREDYRNE